jgi:serine/threonine protein kinase
MYSFILSVRRAQWLHKKIPLNWNLKMSNNVLPGSMEQISATITCGKECSLLVCYVGVKGVHHIESKSSFLKHTISELRTEISSIKPTLLHTQRELSRGNFGTAYLCTYEGSEVCVKYFNNVVNMEEFMHEATLLAHLGNHPNVVKLLGTLTEDDRPGIVMEYAPLDSVKKYVYDSDQYIPLQRLTQISRDICAGVLHMHDNGFIHRDIATRNALRMSDNLVKVRLLHYLR